MSAITYEKETDSGTIEKADILVRIDKTIPLLASTMKFSRVNVYGTKVNGGDINDKLISMSSTTEIAKVKEKDELNFVGSVKVWTIDKLTQKEVDQMKDYGETLVVLSGKSDEVKTNGSSLNFGNMIIFLTETAVTTTLHEKAKMPNFGVVIDVDKKGKALFMITRMLLNVYHMPLPVQIKNGLFTGITTIKDAEQLDDGGFSYFFRAEDDCFVRNFVIGGSSARVEYIRRFLMHAIKNRIGTMIDQGLVFDNNGYTALESAIVNVLEECKKLKYVSEIIDVDIPRASAEARAKGRLDGINIQVRINTEIKTISIIFSGGV